MERENVQQVVDQINAYLQTHLWFDFEVMEYVGYRYVVMGGIDPSVPPDLEIYFDRVAFVSMPIEWMTDTSKPPLTLVTGDALRHLNRKFQVQEGHQIFKFSPEGFPDDFGCYVCAQEISFKIMTGEGSEVAEAQPPTP